MKEADLTTGLEPTKVGINEEIVARDEHDEEQAAPAEQASPLQEKSSASFWVRKKKVILVALVVATIGVILIAVVPGVILGNDGDAESRETGNGVIQSAGDNDAEEPSDAVRAISPEFWPAEELENYKKLNTGNYEDAFHSVAHGPGAAMIVENSNALGAHNIGTKVLEANGTAADTAIAAAVANIVLNFGAPVSFAGYMNAVYFDATKKEAKVLHGHFRTIPENDPRDLLSPSYPLGALTPIPAFFADVEILLETYGSGLFTLGDFLAPSIWLAEQGLYNAAIVDTRDSEAITRTAFGQKLSATLAREPDLYHSLQ